MSSYMLYVFLCIQVHLKNDRNRSLELKEHHIVDPTQQGHIFSERRIIMEVNSPFTIRSDWPFIVYELFWCNSKCATLFQNIKIILKIINNIFFLDVAIIPLRRVRQAIYVVCEQSMNRGLGLLEQLTSPTVLFWDPPLISGIKWSQSIDQIRCLSLYKIIQNNYTKIIHYTNV